MNELQLQKCRNVSRILDEAKRELEGVTLPRSLDQTTRSCLSGAQSRLQAAINQAVIAQRVAERHAPPKTP